jgi:hypothetical protein
MSEWQQYSPQRVCNLLTGKMTKWQGSESLMPPFRANIAHNVGAKPSCHVGKLLTYWLNVYVGSLVPHRLHPGIATPDR